jgi:gluconokinase
VLLPRTSRQQEPSPCALARRDTAAITRAGRFSADAYLALLVDGIDELHERRVLVDVDAVSSCAQWHSSLRLARDGRCLDDVITWAHPAGSAPVADNAEQLRQRTGCALHPLYWTAPHHTGAGDPAVARVLGTAEYIRLVLLGEDAMSVSMAAGTGLLELRTAEWDSQALQVAGVRPGQLPAIAGADHRGTLAGHWRSRWPGLSAVPWHPTIGDGAAMAVAAAGIFETASATITIGTTAAVRALESDHARWTNTEVAPGLWRYLVDASTAVSGAASSAGGGVLAWSRKVMALPGDDDDLDAALSEVDLTRLTVTADVSFERDRPPVTGPGRRASFGGLGPTTTAADMLAAQIETICRQLAGQHRALEAQTGTQLPVVGNGGALTRSHHWQRRLRHHLGRRLYVGREPEHGAIGAALADGLLGLVPLSPTADH